MDRIQETIELQMRLRREIADARPPAPSDAEMAAQAVRDQMEPYVDRLRSEIEALTTRVNALEADQNRLLRCLRVLFAEANKRFQGELATMIQRALSGERL